ncbi:MAG: LON peptidase substrate-binding domain-containing protein [Thermoflexales bacterium]
MSRQVYELPLFPLDVVLFPGQLLPLHIFEPRYRVMIQRCIDTSSPFGVLPTFTLNRAGQAVGTTAHISEVERLQDGRMNILTFGQQRFLLHCYRTSSHGYLIGEVSDYPFAESPQVPPRQVRALQERLQRLVEILGEQTALRLDIGPLPDEPLALAIVAAILLPASLETKQRLLSQSTTQQLFDAVHTMVDREVRLSELADRAIQPPQDPPIPFCRN